MQIREGVKDASKRMAMESEKSVKSLAKAKALRNDSRICRMDSLCNASTNYLY